LLDLPDIDLERESGNGTTALIHTAIRGNGLLVDKLLQRGANPNHRAHGNGETALTMAAIYGHTNVVKRLLKESRIRVADNGFCDMSPIMVSAMGKRLDILGVFSGLSRSKMPEPGKRCFSTLHALATSMNMEHLKKNKIKKQLKDRVRERIGLLTCQDDIGNTPLHVACIDNNVIMLQTMLSFPEGRAVINMQDDKGQTPLYVAATEGHSGLVAILRGAGANIKIRNINGKAPFEIAQQNGFDELAKKLRFSEGKSVSKKAFSSKAQEVLPEEEAYSFFRRKMPLLLSLVVYGNAEYAKIDNGKRIVLPPFESSKCDKFHKLPLEIDDLLNSNGIVVTNDASFEKLRNTFNITIPEEGYAQVLPSCCIRSYNYDPADIPLDKDVAMHASLPLGTYPGAVVKIANKDDSVFHKCLHPERKNLREFQDSIDMGLA